MSETRKIGQLQATLEAFGMKHAAKALPDLLESAERNEVEPRRLLQMVLDSETDGRFARKRKRNYSAAHFTSEPRPLGEFDPDELEGGITASQIEQLKELAWVDGRGNVVLAGPPGLGKTMIALGLGLAALDAGYSVGFESMESLLEVLDKAAEGNKAGFRKNYLQKCDMVIIDEIGYTPIEPDQANRFFSFVNRAYERTSLVITTNKEIEEWAELMGDAALTTAMLDRILHHARCFSLRGESYRLKHPELFASARQ